MVDFVEQTQRTWIRKSEIRSISLVESSASRHITFDVVIEFKDNLKLERHFTTKKDALTYVNRDLGITEISW